MEIEILLEKEIKRLNRLNDNLENTLQGNTNLAVYEQIKNNALAMNEIAKANGLLTDKMFQQINKYLGEKY